MTTFPAPFLAAITLCSVVPASAAAIDEVIVYGDSLWDGGVTGGGCDTCSSYPSSWNVLEYANSGAEAWHEDPCDGAESPSPDDGCRNGEDVALRRAGDCPAAGNTRFPALTPCLEDNADADVVVVQFGSNDVRFPDNQDVVWFPWEEGDGTPTRYLRTEHLAGLKAILDQVQAQHQSCVVITPPPIWDNETGEANPTDYETANARLDELRWLQLSEARSHGCVHVDLYQAFLDYEQAHGELPMLALYNACPAEGLPHTPGGVDCVHLSAAGDSFMGAKVRDAIQASVPRSACDDGIDNDGDGAIDLADAGCPHPRDRSENEFDAGLGCGLGPELALVLPLLWWLRRRRSSALWGGARRPAAASRGAAHDRYVCGRK